jgi:hypothetical protein
MVIGGRKIIKKLIASKAQNKGIYTATIGTVLLGSVLICLGAIFKVESLDGASELLIVGQGCFYTGLAAVFTTVIWKEFFRNKPH